MELYTLSKREIVYIIKWKIKLRVANTEKKRLNKKLNTRNIKFRVNY